MAGSIGSFNPTMTPQMPPPHLLTLTLASPACVIQMPVGSPSVSDLAIGTVRSAARTTRTEQIRKAKVLLWKGHCSVHQMFQVQHVLNFRSRYPEGMVISHPEHLQELLRVSQTGRLFEMAVDTKAAYKLLKPH